MFRFIHTADWQIGKTFGGLPPGKQGVLRDARISAVDAIARTARTNGADHVVVAGDVFDSEALPAREVAHLLERLRSHPNINWHLLPGNHDPDRPGGLYERIVRGGLPQNVRLCRDAEVVALAPGVALLPAPLKARAQTSDPSAWMRQAATPPGTLRIGLAHGAVQGFGSSSDAAARIDPAIARTAGLAYLALGDWHGTKEVAANVWYSGTPEPDRYLGNDSGQALAVTLGDSKSGVAVEPILTRRYAWHGIEMRPGLAEDIDRLAARLAEESDGLDRVMVRLTVTGQVALPLHAEIEARLGELETRLFHLDLDRTGLTIAPERADIAALGAVDLAHAAEQLIALRADPAKRAAADRALEILFRLAAEMAR